MSARAKKSPPTVSLVARVGVTGHRAFKSEEIPDIRKRARIVLGGIKTRVLAVSKDAGGAYAPEAPAFRVVSPVAEGADRIVAEAGLARGYALHAPLPFAIPVYEEDFPTAKSKCEYRALLNQAERILELDGSAATPQLQNRAYLAVGLTVLAQSDILVAILRRGDCDDDANYDPAVKTGGTADIVRRAQAAEIPIVRIVPDDCGRIRIWDPAEKGGKWIDWSDAALDRIVRRLFLPPWRQGGSANRDKHGEERPSQERRWVTYRGERQRRCRWPLWTAAFGLLRNVVGRWSFKIPRFRFEDYEQLTNREWFAAQGGENPAIVANLARVTPETALRHYAWADQLSNRYADLYRSAFVLTYGMSAFAIFFALFAFGMGWATDAHGDAHVRAAGAGAVELALIVFIIVLIVAGRRRFWHQRFLDYRLLAEHFRQYLVVAPFGRSVPDTRPPAHNQEGDARGSWVYWLFRAVAREAGMTSGKVDADYLAVARLVLEDRTIGGQIDYHGKTSAPRDHNLHHRLHRIGLGAFVLTLAACLGHLLLEFDVVRAGLADLAGILDERAATRGLAKIVRWFTGESAVRWLTVATAVLPAVGAAVAGLLFQAEFERMAKRSGSMADWLRAARERIGNLAAPDSMALAAEAEEAARQMIGEVLDWKTVFVTRPLNPPA